MVQNIISYLSAPAPVLLWNTC